MFKSTVLHKQKHLRILLSQRIIERPRDHLLDHQPCNTTYSTFISHVKRKRQGNESKHTSYIYR